jgi:hypothetical protein
MALADAYIAGFEIRYVYDFWGPITAAMPTVTSGPPFADIKRSGGHSTGHFGVFGMPESWLWELMLLAGSVDGIRSVAHCRASTCAGGMYQSTT